MHSRIHSLLRTLVIATTLVAAGPARASDAPPATPCPPRAAAPAPQVRAEAPIAAATAVTPTANGFAGTIVDLSCDVVRLAGGNARCDAGEHHFALRVDGQTGLRALEVAQSTPVAVALHTGELTGKEVCVTGESSPNGVLRVTGIHPLG